jgi:hypothetical protein
MTQTTRREFLSRAAGGFGAMALSAMLAEELRAESAKHADPLAPKPPHHFAKAKRVIFLFMTGGVSHVDTFDPKPRLFADHGKTVTVDNFQGKLGEFSMFLKTPNWKFQPGGKSGILVSDLFPHVRSVVDDLCVIRSMSTNHTNHYESTLGMHCGSWTFARPSIGAWVSYGLGTENRNLPSFVVLAPSAPYAGAQTWERLLPGAHQGTHIVPDRPHRRRETPAASAALQRMELDLLAARIVGTLRSVLPRRRWKPASGRSKRPSECRARPRPLWTCPVKPRPRYPCTACSRVKTPVLAGSASSLAGWRNGACDSLNSST